MKFKKIILPTSIFIVALIYGIIDYLYQPSHQNLLQIHKDLQQMKFQDQLVNCKINGYFLTQNFYPLQDCQIHLKIGQDQIGPAFPDAIGRLNISMPTIQNDSINGLVTIVIGHDLLSQEYNVTFTKSNQYTITQNFILTPPDLSPIDIKGIKNNQQQQGCLVDGKHIPITIGIINTLYYYQQYFIEGDKKNTDSKGCFEFIDKVKVFDIVRIVMTISAVGCTSQQIIMDQDIGQLNHTFLMPFVLQREFADIYITARLIDQLNQPINGVQGFLSCQYGEIFSAFPLAYSNSSGILVIESGSSLKLATQYQCIMIFSDMSQLFSNVTQDFGLVQNNERYEKNLGNIELKQNITNCLIQGIITDDNQRVVPNITLQFQISDQTVTLHNISSNQNGEYSMSFACYKGRNYSINVTAYLLFYKPAYYQVVLNFSNNYTFTIPKGILKIEKIPQPVQVQINGQVVLADKQPAQNQSVKIIVTQNSSQIFSNTTQTNQQGNYHFQFQGFDTLSYNVSVTINDNDFEDVTNISQIVSKNENYIITMPMLVIQRRPKFALLQGQLIENATSKISNAKIIVTSNTTTVPVIYSDSNGNFSVQYIVTAGSYQAITLTITALYFDQYFKSNVILSNSINYQVNFGQIQMQRTQLVAILQGQCVQNGTSGFITQGTLTVIDINPPIKQIIPVSSCGVSGNYNISFPVLDGYQYSGSIFYNDNNQSYVQFSKSFTLGPENYYHIISNLGIFQALNIIISGVVKDVRSRILPGTQINLQFYSNLFPNISTTTDNNGVYNISKKLFTLNRTLQCTITIISTGYVLQTQIIVFNQQNNYIITNNYLLVSNFLPISIRGQVKDTFNNPLVNALITFQSQDNLKNQFLPNTTISDNQGNFVINTQISRDFDYIVQISVSAQYCESIEQISYLNQSNNYVGSALNIVLNRQLITLTFKAHVQNSFQQKLSDASVNITFNPQSIKQSAFNIYNLATDRQGNIKIKQDVFQGLEYNGQFSINASGYTIYYGNISFNQQNYFLQEFTQIQVLRPFITSSIQGTVFNKADQSTVKNCYITLRFDQGYLENMLTSNYSQTNGNFYIIYKIEQDFLYTPTILARSANLNDHSAIIALDNQNNYQITGLIIQMNNDITNITGQIFGRVYKTNGNIIPQAKIILLFQISNNSIVVNTNSTGLFQFQNITLIQGNYYDPIITTIPNDQNYQTTVTQLEMTQQNLYMQTDLIILCGAKKIQFQVSGQVIDFQSRLPLINVVIMLIFDDQTDTKNTYVTTDPNGNFSLIGIIDGGVPFYNFLLVVLRDQYETQNLKLNIQNSSQYTLRNQIIQLKSTKSIQLQFFNYQENMKISGKIFCQTDCNIFPKMFLPFTQVNLYLIESVDSHLFMGYVYTSNDGSFSITIPSFKYENIMIQAYLLIQLEGYIEKKQYLQIQGSDDIYFSQIQIAKSDGILQHCTVFQQFFQKQYDKMTKSIY